MAFLIILYYLCALALLFIFLKEEFISPTTIFIVSQAIFFSGFIKYLDYKNADDNNIVLIYIIAIIFFGVGASFGRIIHPYRESDVTLNKLPLKRFQRQRIKIIIAISFALFFYFCYKTRLSTITSIVGNLLYSNGSDITSLRLESYSVPGTAFIYMFRVSLLPTIVVCMWNKEYNYSRTKRIVCAGFMLCFTLITGQRGGFAMVMFMWILTFAIRAFYLKNKAVSKKMTRNIMLAVSAFIVTFSFMSVINGRVDGSIIGEFVQRFLEDNQNTAYVSFHYIFDEGVTWGRNWYEELINIITPGDRYLPLSKKVFSLMYGSTRGTAPPCLWGSVFYNFSWVGIIVFAFVHGYFAQYIGYKFYVREITALRCAVYSYMFIDVGMLIAGGPFQLVNNGFVPLVFMSYYLHIDKDVNMVGSMHVTIPKLQ